MSVIQTYPFNDQADYNVSNIAVAAGIAKMAKVDKPSLTFLESFDSATGFTYDNTKAEFVGNLLRQKDQSILPTPINGSNVSIVANSVLKNAGGTAWNASANTSQSLASGDGKISWNVSAGASASMCGLTTTANLGGNYALINFAIYLGLADDIQVFELGTPVGTFGSYLTTDVFTVAVESGAVKYKKNGVTFYTSLVAPTYPLYGGIAIYTQGLTIQNISLLFTSQYFESKADLPTFSYSTLGSIRVLTNLTLTEVGVPKYIIEGQYWNGSAWVVSNGSYAQSSTRAIIVTNLPTLDVVDETAIAMSVTFPDGNTLASVDALTLTYTGQKYPASAYLEPITGLDIASIVDYSQLDTIVTNTTLKIILKIDGILKYWNGSAWVTSDGTAAQANTEADVAANIGALDLGSNSTVFIRWLFSTTDDQVTAELDSATIEYEFGAIKTDPVTCIVFGYYRDIAGEPVQGATVTFSLVRPKKEYTEANKNIIEASVAVTTDSNGYFQTALIRSSEYENGGTYKVVIEKSASSLLTSKNPDKSALTFEVPDASTKDITDLFPAA